MCLIGKGVPRDYVSAHMWFNLSGSNGYKDSVINRIIVELRMSPSQIEKAKKWQETGNQRNDNQTTVTQLR